MLAGGAAVLGDGVQIPEGIGLRPGHKIGSREGVLIGKDLLADGFGIEGGADEKLIVGGALEIVEQRAGVVVVGCVVEHQVHIVKIVGEDRVVRETDEDGQVVHIPVVGVLVAEHLPLGGHHHLAAQLEVLLSADAHVGHQSLGGGVALARNPIGGLDAPVFLDGIDKIAGLRVLYNGVSLRVVQAHIVFVARSKTVQRVAVGLDERAGHIGEISGIQRDTNKKSR